MTRRFVAVAIMLTCMVATPAFARHHKTNKNQSITTINCGRFGCTQVAKRHPTKSVTNPRSNDVSGPMGRISHKVEYDPRPRAWCGWWMRQQLGIADRSLNLARNWARYGTNAHGPAIGAIVVWPHHVGQIVGRTESGWIIKSGNDGHQVRERERSLRGAIAFRFPNGVALR